MSLLSPLTLPWDIAILFLLVIGSTVSTLAWKRSFDGSMNRWKKTVIYVIALLLTGATLLLIYGAFIEPQIIVVTRRNVTLSLKKPLTVAVISDMHVGPYKGIRFVTRTVRRINALKPDIVLIAGDFVLDEEVSASGLLSLAPLKDLQSTYGTFAVPGNHDHGIFRYFNVVNITRADHSDQLVEYLRNLGVTVLLNESKNLHVGSGTLSIAGMEEVWSGKADILRTLALAHHPTILLSHNPDIILDPASDSADLIISGHTHGGQIRLPKFGPLSSLPTRIGMPYDQGIFALPSGNMLAITRGIGESGPRARLFAPPEILLLQID